MNTPIPEKFIDSLATLLNHSETDELVKALDTTPVTGVRINPAKPYIGTQELAVDKNVPWCKHGYILKNRPQFTLMPELHAGAFYVQEPSSMIICEVVSRLLNGADTPILYLDICAAPGGKTTSAISALPAGSLVVANEYVPQRAHILKENVQKWGFPGTVVTSGDTSRPGRLGGMFDIVAVDAPCSGEGMMRKEEEARRQWSEELVKQCAATQREILANAWAALKPGGHLIYSTCTFNRIENEDMVKSLMTGYGAEPIDLGLPDTWGIGASIDPDVPAMRFMPHITEGEGLFMCVMRKPGILQNTATGKTTKSKRKGKEPKEPTGLRSMLLHSDDYIYKLRADGLWHAFPTAYLNVLERIEAECNVISAGVELCTEKHHDLIPAHGLALSTALNSEAFPHAEVDTTQALSYLRREALTLPPDTPAGYVLLIYGGLPLGFVKNLGKRANNLYPQAWRIRHL